MLKYTLSKYSGSELDLTENFVTDFNITSKAVIEHDLEESIDGILKMVKGLSSDYLKLKGEVLEK